MSEFTLSDSVLVAATPDADLVVHASGNPAGLQTALRLAGVEATILEMSWYGTRPVTLARSLTQTFAGIRPDDVGGFVLAQLLGMLAACAVAAMLQPAPEITPTSTTPESG